MKQAILKFTGKKFIAAVILSASVLLTSVSANASCKGNDIEIATGEHTNVQFTGSTSDALLFRVHVTNINGDNFTLIVKNSNGEVLFSKSFTDTDFQKQFKVLKTDDSKRYYFTIVSNNKDLEDTYVISTETRIIDDVVVNKL